jgi:hypothetical protein
MELWQFMKSLQGSLHPSPFGNAVLGDISTQYSSTSYRVPRQEDGCKKHQGLHSPLEKQFFKGAYVSEVRKNQLQHDPDNSDTIHFQNLVCRQISVRRSNLAAASTMSARCEITNDLPDSNVAATCFAVLQNCQIGILKKRTGGETQDDAS